MDGNIENELELSNNLERDCFSPDSDPPYCSGLARAVLWIWHCETFAQVSRRQRSFAE